MRRPARADAASATARWVGAEAIGFAVPVLWTRMARTQARARFAAA